MYHKAVPNKKNIQCSILNIVNTYWKTKSHYQGNREDRARKSAHRETFLNEREETGKKASGKDQGNGREIWNYNMRNSQN